MSASDVPHATCRITARSCISSPYIVISPRVLLICVQSFCFCTRIVLLSYVICRIDAFSHQTKKAMEIFQRIIILISYEILCESFHVKKQILF